MTESAKKGSFVMSLPFTSGAALLLPSSPRRYCLKAGKVSSFLRVSSSSVMTRNGLLAASVRGCDVDVDAEAFLLDAIGHCAGDNCVTDFSLEPFGTCVEAGDPSAVLVTLVFR